MAKSRRSSRAASEESGGSTTKPQFAYTTKPGSLRRFLQMIPERPKPPKVNATLLKAWGFKDSNDQSIIRVLKAVRLINDSNEPTETYMNFMKLNEGGKALGPEIKRVYAKLFESAHAPYSESTAALKNLFNIHSGGGERAIEYQIQTFKALCEQASFGTEDAVTPAGKAGAAPTDRSQDAAHGGAQQTGPVVHIDLHIHLPENKSQRDYQNIIEDIGRHIFGRNPGGSSA